MTLLRSHLRIPSGTNAGRRRPARAQGLVELALVAPVFFALLFSAVDLGRVVWANVDLGHAAREGARWASVHGNSLASECQTGPAGIVAPPVLCTPTSPDTKEPTRVVARSHLAGTGSATVAVCYFTTTQCTGNTDEAHAANAKGEFVTVTVTSHVGLTVAALLGGGGIDVKGTATVLINN